MYPRNIRFMRPHSSCFVAMHGSRMDKSGTVMIMPHVKQYTSPPSSSAVLFAKIVSPRMCTSDDSAYIAPDSNSEETWRHNTQSDTIFCSVLDYKLLCE